MRAPLHCEARNPHIKVHNKVTLVPLQQDHPNPHWALWRRCWLTPPGWEAPTGEKRRASRLRGLSQTAAMPEEQHLQPSVCLPIVYNSSSFTYNWIIVQHKAKEYQPLGQNWVMKALISMRLLLQVNSVLCLTRTERHLFDKQPLGLRDTHQVKCLRYRSYNYSDRCPW